MVYGRLEYSFYYQNVRGLRSKINTFSLNLMASNFDIIALTETNLQPSINTSELFPDTFNVYRCDRDLEATGKQGGGGVLMAVSKNILSTRLNNLQININGCEYVWVKITNNKGKIFYVSVVYFRPRSPLGVYQAYYDFLQQIDFSANSYVVILGDFNLPIYGLDYHLNEGDNLCRELSIFLNLNNFNLKNNVLNFQNKTLDLVISNIDNVEVTRCEDQLVAEDPYHPAIEVRIVVMSPLSFRSRSTDPAGYCFRRADFFTIYQDLALVDWTHLYSITDVNIAVDYFYNQMYTILDKSCPPKKDKRSKYPFWFTPSIISNIKLKEKLRNKYKKCSTLENYNRFKDQRALLKLEIRTAYNDYLQDIENSINADSSKFWNVIKSKKSDKNKLLVMEYNGASLDNGTAITTAFADYFSSVYENYTVEPSVESAVAGPCLAGVSCLTLPHVTQRDVQEAITKLKSKSTAGPDFLPQYLFKGCSELLVNPLTFLYNLSLNSHVFPEKWKITKITPIFKSGLKSHVTNHRPVAVLNVPAKIFEIIVQKCLFTHFKQYISPAQHGFVPGRSVTTNLLNFTRYISSGLDSGTQTDSLFLDLAKAFDKVDHQILLNKLHRYGLSLSFLQFFQSYIINRKQFVVYNGFNSSTFNVQSGVPQGSNLGPCLFTILINDLSDCIHYSKALLFADDLKVFKHITKQTDAVQLQFDLDSVFRWSVANKMLFNTSKCQVMTFSRSRHYSENTYFLNGKIISRVNEKIKDLGVLVDAKLSFNFHVNACLASASKTMGFIIRQGVNFRKTETLIMLYNSLVRSRLENNVIIWNPFHVTYQDALERIQKRFLRYLFYRCFNFFTYTIPYDELLELFGFMRLEQRRTVACLVFLYKLVRGLVDDPASLAALSYRVPAFNSRSNQLFSLPYCRTTAHASSPLYRVMRSYNSIRSSGSDVDIFNDSPFIYKRKCLASL